MGSVYQFISELFQKERPHLIRKEIGRSGVPADSRKDYFRVRLAEMYLKDERAWLRTVFPTLGAITRCQFANNQQELSHVIDPTKMIQPRWGTGLILRDVVMCPTLPFRGQTVELTAVLKSMVVANHLTALVGTLARFSSLLAIPQLSAVIQVAGPLAQGVQDLFTSGGGGSVLGYIETFDKDTLQAGHIAVVKADANAIDPTKLTVNADHLLYNGVDLTGFDYFLLRLEVFDERDDHESITTIYDPLRAALTQLSRGDTKAADREKTAAILAAQIAPELTTADRRRVIEGINAQYEQAKRDYGISGATAVSTNFSLTQWVRSAGSAAEAACRGPIQEHEVFPMDGA